MEKVKVKDEILRLIEGSEDNRGYIAHLVGKYANTTTRIDREAEVAAYEESVGAVTSEIPKFSEVYGLGEGIPAFSDYANAPIERTGLSYLNESENAEVDANVLLFEEECGSDLSAVDEGFLGKLIGGAAGFLVGPSIGRIIARALGIERGIIYDMLTSRLVTTALGVAIAKYMGGEYRDRED